MIQFSPYTEKYGSEEACLLAFFTHSLHEEVFIFSKVEDWRPLKALQKYFFDNSTIRAWQPYFILEWFLLKNAFLTSCESPTIKCFPMLLMRLLKWNCKNWFIKQSRVFLSWYWFVVKCWKQFRFLLNILTSNSAESQIDLDLETPQLIQTEKMLQIITSKDSSTNTIEEGKEIFVIQLLKGNINGLKNQLKDKEKK